MKEIKLDLKMKNYKDMFDCRVNAIANCASYQGFDYEMYAIGRWQFYFSYKEDIGDGLEPYRLRRTNALKKFHNIDVKKIKNTGSEFIEKIINVLKNGLPVIAKSDLFVCPWVEAYGKYHFSHFFILVGVKNDFFIGCDPFFNKEYIEISFNEFIMNIKEIEYFRKGEEKKVDRMLAKEEIIKDIIEYRSMEMKKNILEFSDVLYNWDGINELSYLYKTGRYIFPLVDNIRIFMTNRVSYIVLLKYLTETNRFLLRNSIQVAEECVKHWRMLRSVLIKNIIGNNKYKDDVKKRLSLIAIEEEKFIDCLENELEAVK